VLVALGGAVAIIRPAPGSALVQGNEVPEDYKDKVKRFRGQRPKNCMTVEECREIGEQKQLAAMAEGPPVVYSVTASGARYKDVENGTESAGVARQGDSVQIKYRVMRSGKRSRDGISGEASTIFSLGYGEDDARDPKATLSVKLGDGRLVKALDEAVVGMAVGGTRRIQVKSENGMGWKKPGDCAKTKDLGVQLISAGEDNDLCLDEAKLPQPADYGAKRRFLRRFDENLIVEAELVSIGGR